MRRKIGISVLGGLLILGGCADDREAKLRTYVQDHRLPHGADEITHHGNGWTTFRWQGHYFLFQLTNTGRDGQSVLTQIDFVPEPTGYRSDL